MLSSRTSYEEWKNDGQKDVIRNAKARTEKLLQEQKVQTLPADKEQALEDILNDARQYYYKTGKITEEEWKLYQEDIHSPNYPFA